MDVEGAEYALADALLRSGAAFFDSVLVRRDGKQAQPGGLARPASAPGRRTTSRGSADDSAARSASAPVPTTSALTHSISRTTPAFEAA